MAMKIRKRCYDCKTFINGFEKYHADPEQHHRIFAELGFTYPRLNLSPKSLIGEHAGTSVEDGCDGFCPECAQMLKCEAYQKELKNEWEWIYS